MSPTEQVKTIGLARVDVPGYGMVHKIAPASAMKVILDTVTKFCQTAAEHIGPEHVTVPCRLNFTLNESGLAKTRGDAAERKVALDKEAAAEAEFVGTPSGDGDAPLCFSAAGRSSVSGRASGTPSAGGTR